MATGLIKVVVSKKKNKDITITSQKTLLLATDRVLDMSDSGSPARCTFYYDIGIPDNRDLPCNFTCTNWSSGSLGWAIERADRTNSRFWVHVMYQDRVTGGRRITIDKMVKLYTSQLIYAWEDPDGLHCYAVISRGSNIYRLTLSHTLDDLIRASSKSASLSASLLSGGTGGGRIRQ
jgi:hypothetical protein